MSRPPRLDLAGITQHVLQRGVDRRPCFMRTFHYSTYLQLLGQYATQFGCAIHAYVLMTNHVHLLVTPGKDGGVGKLMQALGRKYVSFANFTMGRTGTLWEGRYKSCLVADDPYVLACYRYIELNPVRANMVLSPADYAWSSFAVNGIGCPGDLVTPHSAYCSLGTGVSERCAAYAEWLRARQGSDDEAAIRLLTNRQRAFAGDHFRERLEREHGRPMGPLKAGRPQKPPTASIR